jgi:hypothetical protein
MAREADDGPKCESAVTDDDDDDDDDDANAEDDRGAERTTAIIMTPLPNDLLWIPDLVRGVFFAPCERHSAGTKGEQVNLFSVGRRRAMCPACAAESSVSDAIQVRKRDVIEGLDDARGGGVFRTFVPRAVGRRRATGSARGVALSLFVPSRRLTRAVVCFLWGGGVIIRREPTRDRV